MSDLTTATARTVAPATYSALAVELLRRILGVELDPTIAGALTLAVTTAVYNVARRVEARWPWLGPWLLWSRKTPTYGG